MQKNSGNQVTQEAWPKNGLESVRNCPVCGSSDRQILYDTLKDKVFFCAPGEWILFSCKSCASAYLDPRPNHETIGLAYQSYYTHNAEADFLSLNLIGKIQRMLVNGYRNHRYGTQSFPSSVLGVFLVSFMPNGRAIIDAGMRHLPKLKDSTSNRLLDLGCGNGVFLARARSASWSVVGADFDSKAVGVARKQGLDVRLGGIELFDSAVEQFDVITLSHVIEHVHHPEKLLSACYKLLKPGGFVWIETPNISSEGHRFFGADWRGLEPPRHLVIFNMRSLQRLLSSAGFSVIEEQPFRSCKSIFFESKAIKEGIDPYLTINKKGGLEELKKLERIAKNDVTRREFITIKAWKHE